MEADSFLYAPFVDSLFCDHESVIGKVPVSCTYEIEDKVVRRFVGVEDGNYADDAMEFGCDVRYGGKVLIECRTGCVDVGCWSKRTTAARMKETLERGL